MRRTRARVPASQGQGIVAPPAASWGMIETKAATRPMPRPPIKSEAFSQRTIAARRRRRKPATRIRARLGAALQDAAQLNDGQPDRAEQKTQAAEALECREISVLHCHERGQLGGRRFGIETVVAKHRFQSRAHFGRRLLLRVHQKIAVAADIGEIVQQIGLGHQHVALKNAVLQ